MIKKLSTIIFTNILMLLFLVFLNNTYGIFNENNIIKNYNITTLDNIKQINVGGGVIELFEDDFRGNIFETLSFINKKLNYDEYFETTILLKNENTTVINAIDNFHAIITYTNHNNKLNTGKSLTYCVVKTTVKYINNNIYCKIGTVWYK